MVDCSGHVWGPLETIGVIAVALIGIIAVAIFTLIMMCRPRPQPQQQDPLPGVAAIRAIFTHMGHSVTARDIESGLIALESVGGVRGASPVAVEHMQHQSQSQSQNQDKQ